MNLKAQKWKFMKRVDSLQGSIVRNEVRDPLENRLIIFGGSLAPRTPDIALGFDCVCFRVPCGEGSMWKVEAHRKCSPPVQPTCGQQAKGQV